MGKINIASTKTTVSANEANSTYVLAKGATVDTTYAGITGMGTAEGTRFQLDGHLKSADGNGLSWGHEFWGGTAIDIEIGKSGRVRTDGGTGIELYGDDHHVDNAGKITGYVGLTINGSDSTLRNSGSIDGEALGISSEGDMSLVNSGTIASSKLAIFLQGDVFDTGSVIRNTGLIQGHTAILGTALGERVVNSSKISGDIVLGDGEDTFVFKRGSHTDEAVQGGDDGDRYIVHTKNAEIHEELSQGFDWVKSTVSYKLSDNIEQINLLGKGNINATGNDEGNHVQGNAGNNVLRGEGGIDYLLGMAGNDRLIGGDDADYFAFLKGSGRDTVVDFEIGIDEIQLGSLKGASTFENMMDKHTVQKGDDVWITYGHDVVILKNIDADHLQATDFNFG